MLEAAQRTTLRGRLTAPIDGGERFPAIRWLFPLRELSCTVVQSEPLRIGRDPDCDVRLEGSETSRIHAELRRDGGQVIVRDRDSTNGVWVNGRRVTEAKLATGAILRIGDWIGAITSVGSLVEVQEPGLTPVLPDYWVGPAVRPLLEPLRRAAESDLPIVIEGETGTGKEGIARIVHTWSRRPGGLVPVNCAALPEALAEGELFGYRKGAFTGADRDHPGYFRAAEAGTLFLDEILDLPAPLQPKLLRALEQSEIVPLGAARPLKVDVRVTVAAQSPLARAVEEKRLRPDLFARLDGLTVHLPPLRERLTEVPELFVRMVARRLPGRVPEVDAKLIEQLCLYDWPFNIRELQLLVRRLATLHGHERVLKRSHLPRRMLEARSRVPDGQEQPQRDTPASRALLRDALRRNQGNVARAAAAIGISRQRAYRLMEQEDVEPSEFRAAAAAPME